MIFDGLFLRLLFRGQRLKALIIGKREFVTSLRTSQLAIAKCRANAESLRALGEIDRARRQLAAAADDSAKSHD
jgi:hypothetical protein